jgi:2-hydroxychromene-2-carboxylate isomerase
MGTLIDLEAHRQNRRTPVVCEVPCRVPARLFFDVVSPFTYLAAERIERLFPNATWCAVDPGVDAAGTWTPEARRLAEARAADLGMPLTWPDEREVPRHPEPGHGLAARRASAYAVSRGRGAPFATVAGRLSFCGGYDLDDPDVLAEAAVAARLAPGDVLDAAGDGGWDAQLAHAAARVAGLRSLPVLECANRVFSGEHRVADAVAASFGQ